ncbi:hypothetical protein CEK25_009367 [Fusarium fujikuroi]|nr:hypothetical protein CEK25_009367 [Fusarium fujikuroi]
MILLPGASGPNITGQYIDTCFPWDCAIGWVAVNEHSRPGAYDPNTRELTIRYKVARVHPPHEATGSFEVNEFREEDSGEAGIAHIEKLEALIVHMKNQDRLGDG